MYVSRPHIDPIGTAPGIAAESEGTAGQTALLLTQHQVIQVSWHRNVGVRNLVEM